MDREQLDRLVIAAQGGDQDAFLCLAEAVQPTIRATIAACASHPGQVDDLVHETLISVWRGIDHYRPSVGGGFPAWVRTIARNHLRKALRSRRIDVAVSDIEAVIIDSQLERLTNEEESMHRASCLERLRDCLQRLSGPVRRLVEGHHLEGRPLADLASELQRTASWVAVNLFRARQVLAACVRSGSPHEG